MLRRSFLAGLTAAFVMPASKDAWGRERRGRGGAAFVAPVNSSVQSFALPSSHQLPPMPTSGCCYVLGNQYAINLYHLDFCNRYPDQCGSPTTSSTLLPMTQKYWKELHDVNQMINNLIEPVADNKHHGVEERWDMAETGRGDCEEFAWRKKKEFLQKGYPETALLVAHVQYLHQDGKREGHYVLVVRFENFDVILDNIRPQILTVDQASNYSHLAVTDPYDPRRFRQIMGMTTVRQPESASTRYIISPYAARVNIYHVN